VKVLLVAGEVAREREATAALARGLAAGGWQARVLAAARAEGEPRVERAGDEFRLVRTDAAPGHWQRSRSAAAARLVRALLREEAPDLVHVLSWRGLTHDLVALAAEAGVRAVVTLSDPWFGCLVGDRVRRGAGLEPEPRCAEPLGPSPCLGCAEAAFGRTPWVPIEARFLAVAERRRDVLRELELARRVIVPDAAAAEAARRALASDLARVAFEALGPAPDAAAQASVYASALAGPAPAPTSREPEWWVERMQVESERAWDEAFRRAEQEAS